MNGLLLALKSVNNAFALVGYLAAVGAWSWVAPQAAKLKSAKQSLDAVPAEQRIRALEVIYGPIPAGIAADDWVRDRRNRLILIAFLGLVFALVATIALVVHSQ